jgi:hypothetical protein
MRQTGEAATVADLTPAFAGVILFHETSSAGSFQGANRSPRDDVVFAPRKQKDSVVSEFFA